MIIFRIIWSILGIILFFKVWKMCNDVRELRNQFCYKDEPSTVGTPNPSIVKPEGAKFGVGQLVIVKSNESQFRIDSVAQKGEDFVYYSEKFNRDFSADEIEDFDEYWRIKKNTNC